MGATGAVAVGSIIKVRGAGGLGVQVPTAGTVDIADESVPVAPPQRSH
jgi:hypothetical protein